MWKMDVFNQNGTGGVYAVAALENTCKKRNGEQDTTGTRG